MTSGHFKPQAETTGFSDLTLEIADQETKSPRLIPVLIRNLSTGGVTLTVTNPWDIPDWDRYRGEDCVLRVEDPGGGEPVNIRAQIAWTRSGGTGQPPLSLGLQLINPPGEAISRLSNLLPHTSQDIKGLWDRYDQVRENPGNSDLVHHCYIAGLVLLLGGLVLQFAGSPAYKVCGWVLWLIGSLGIAGKIIRPLWQKQSSSDRIGKTL
ncbi:MAG TPA: PilZ domain-containing protein [Desulfobaccales bacterium]|nr:PilZ domain-containing protein [Desulfobaccales bacterium]